MKLHIVGGFLGSGKTTAIASALRILARRGIRAGVITNDQGKSLVDGLFMGAQGSPGVEVAGGCFCCRYEDFGEKLASLAARERPAWIFAESVGSCADLVSTVVRPIALAAYGASGLELEGQPSFSVFVDARLLELRLAGRPLPFSEELCYLFDRQLEEAGLVVVNKADLVREPEATAAAYRGSRPGVRVRTQISRDEDSVAAWMAELEGSDPGLAGSPIEVDYKRYGRAEASLAWADVELALETAGEPAPLVFRSFFAALETRLRQAFTSIGHCKAMLYYGENAAKLSFTSLASPEGPSYDEVSKLQDTMAGRREGPYGAQARALLNLRVEGQASRLEAELRLVLAEFEASSASRLDILSLAAFSPSPPEPPRQRV
jgi:hypothetical protein